MVNKISIGLFDEHRLASEGISFILNNKTDIDVVFNVANKKELLDNLAITPVHILIINIHTVNTPALNLLMQIHINQPKVKTLITSVHNDENAILRIIKAGSKGFLSKDSGQKELIEAIYTLRNGHDYYSDSITHLLVKKYVATIQDESTAGYTKLSSLSSRELEIIQLWGNSFTNMEIADKLFISIRTVESHKNHIMQKLNLKTAVDLVKFAIKNNIIEIH